MLKKIYNIIESLISENIGTEKSQLEGFYHALDGLDVGLDVGLVVFIIFLLMSGTPNLILGLISIALCATAFVTSSMLRKRGWISKGRFIFCGTDYEVKIEAQPLQI